ncbi:hypothetical protein V495_02439 [Pseudogymnoascus sp. VKM F-4514 (FW-929)]|nr:hypothetical protein V490_07941 [Pseudogymnoascus sp. VKM F-3557]KFY46479.1 hypothetical protein V495_02439 [Pseudogymnoascus sp. VKM F-4514 (FW-929)]KFY51536.1 hypothetical protein V497_09048 [Pseudogymnoascus sp. VKM F-4516 (FW-969)]
MIKTIGAGLPPAMGYNCRLGPDNADVPGRVLRWRLERQPSGPKKEQGEYPSNRLSGTLHVTPTSGISLLLPKSDSEL